MTDTVHIVALLGPTNTGKTHRAVERMLEHESGMLGLPLRLLAREIYDRVSARIGEARVALVTGEEKRIPTRPDYWICTVEAMPMDREVDFLAVDEVQLAAHRERGHVFTERLLHARGRRETWLLGAETMRPLVAELCPTARVEGHPRLSQLTAAPSRTLGALPRRTAVVAFSVGDVYELAERLRRLHGGAAVVLGALSPRTRNAQVALYQSGEVDYMVATDAIGMGLNLDVDHVAFATLSKFDGHEVRQLEDAELAQVAGRAGRYLRDGTFGALAPLTLPEGTRHAIEAHRFAAVRHVMWRSSELDFASVDALLSSLVVKPRRRCLRLARHADDHQVLTALARRGDVRAAARGSERVRLLWDVSRVPDYRQILLEDHVALLDEVFRQLSGPRRVLDPAWLDARLSSIDAPDADIDTLTARLASIRIWTYVAHRPGWIADAAAYQERARSIEDRLGDALHERLVQRFVEPRASRTRARPSGPRTRGRGERGRASENGDSFVADGPFARLRELRLILAPSIQGTAEPPDLEKRVADWVDAPFERFRLDIEGRILDADEPLARITRGPDVLRPEVRVLLGEELGAGSRSRVQRRLMAWTRDLVGTLLAPLRRRPPRSLSAAARGLAYQLEQGLGTALARGAREQIEALSDKDRADLEELDVQLGKRCLFLRSALGADALRDRAALASAFHGRFLPHERAVGSPSFAAKAADPAALLSVGYLRLGPRAVRADVVEHVVEVLDAELAAAVARQGEAASIEVPAGLARRLGCPPRQVARVLTELGYALANQSLESSHFTRSAVTSSRFVSLSVSWRAPS